jgi:hypothetical protein
MATELMQEAVQCLAQLSDEQVRQTIIYIKSFPLQKQPLQNSKTPEERLLAAKAVENLLSMSFVSTNNISKDGGAEAAEAALKKYESIS